MTDVVYLLRCADGSLYCGWTNALERRLRAHAAGTASRYTRSRRPLALALVAPMADRGEAMREEARIKRLPKPAKELWLAETVGVVPAFDDAALALDAEPCAAHSRAR